MKILLSLALFFGLSLPNVFGQAEKNALEISHLTGNFYIYTTYKSWNGSLVPSNSMYLVTDGGVALFDTPWDEAQFQPLLDSISARHNKPVVLCIATHYHADRTAGLEFLNQKGVKTYTSKQTYDLCKKYDEKQAAHYFVKDTTFTLGNHQFETYYAGEGHTKDNIIVWFGKEKILYGGCLIKSVENKSLGNIADANLAAWPLTIKKVMQKYRKPKFIIPGHFSWASNKALKHTAKLLEKSR